tara:strand:+ start:1737 stop:1964 length:228 start_codon:yes stop_codon:yes gene_type:complete
MSDKNKKPENSNSYLYTLMKNQGVLDGLKENLNEAEAEFLEKRVRHMSHILSEAAHALSKMSPKEIEEFKRNFSK